MAELPRLYYFADPMCSWCYGFAPVMDKVRKAFGAQFDIRLVMGGLRPGKLAEPMTPARARLMRQHWREPILALPWARRVPIRRLRRLTWL